MTNQEQLQALAAGAWRMSPLATGLGLWPYETKQEKFLPAPHLKLISDAVVDAFTDNGLKNIMVFAPPRSGKSYELSLYTPIWYLGNFPNKDVMMLGYGDDFAQEWGGRVRGTIKNSAAITGLSLSADMKAVDRWRTRQGGGMKTAGVGGQITGRGANLMIIDDPIKNSDEAYSASHRDKIWSWWSSTASSRIQSGGVCIITMTRWHADDLAGRLLNTKYSDPSIWKVLNFPAIWEDNEPQVMSSGGKILRVRKKGEALWPQMFDEQFFDVKKRTIDAETWEALYQQRPASDLGLGRVYHGFKESRHVAQVWYNPDVELCWSLDFNVDPMCSVLAQCAEGFNERSHLTNETVRGINVLQEICLKNANTLEACQEFYDRTRNYNPGGKIAVRVFGDATGKKRQTSATQSDWDIVRDFFKDHNHRFSMRWNVTQSNPHVRERVNCTNGIFGGPILIDPSCRELIADLRDVRWKRDASGNATGKLDDSDKERTHISDAFGYLIYNRFNKSQYCGGVAALAQ